MNRILHQLTNEQIKTGPNGNRVVFVHLPDGQVVKVDLNLYTKKEIQDHIDGYNSDVDGFDVHAFMGIGLNTDEKVELGFLTYFTGYDLKIIETREEMLAAQPAHEKHWEMIANQINNV